MERGDHSEFVPIREPLLSLETIDGEGERFQEAKRGASVDWDTKKRVVRNGSKELILQVDWTTMSATSVAQGLPNHILISA